VDGAFARPFPFAEVRVTLLDPLDEGGRFKGVTEGDSGSGGGGGLAYSSVHCRAIRSCVARLRRNSVAIDGTNGSEGFGSVSRELSESTTLKIDSAGDQLFFRMSMHTYPLSEIFMWYIRV